MAVETLTITLNEAEDVEGDDHISGDKDDNQIVTVRDGGDLTDDGYLMFEKWGKGAPTEPGAGPGGDDRFLFDLSTFNDTFDIHVKSMDAGDVFQFSGYDSYTPPGPGDDTHTFTYTGSDGLDYTVQMHSYSANTDDHVTVIANCFGRGTLIDTPRGQRPVEDLAAGDMVSCGDGQARAVRWVGARRIGPDELRANPRLCPVEFAPGALGAAGPDRPLVLSPHHKVVLGGAEVELLFGTPQVMAPACQLVDGAAIRWRRDRSEVEYFHILLDGHHWVRANGLACETLMPGSRALGALDAAARAEILSVFPQLARDLAAFGPPVCPGVSGAEIRALRRAA